MTPSTPVAPSVPNAPEGTVFDIGYQSYGGERQGRGRAWYAVFKDGLRAALGFGRGGKAKILPWLFIATVVLIAFIMALVVGAIYRIGGAEAAAEVNLPSHSDFYGIASIIYFVLASVGAPELLCPDRRDGVINLYLVRPTTASDYVTARWSAFLAVMLIAAWLPQVVLLIGLTMGNPDPIGYATEHWADIPKFLLAGAAIAAYTTTLAMMVASFTTRRAYASVFLIGLFVISTPFTTGLAMEIGGTVGGWISMFNLSNIPVHVNDIIFDEISAITTDAPAGEFSARLRVAWFFAWTVVPGVILWGRYRRLTP